MNISTANELKKETIFEIKFVFFWIILTETTSSVCADKPISKEDQRLEFRAISSYIESYDKFKYAYMRQPGSGKTAN